MFIVDKICLLVGVSTGDIGRNDLESEGEGEAGAIQACSGGAFRVATFVFEFLSILWEEDGSESCDDFTRGMTATAWLPFVSSLLPFIANNMLFVP